LRCSRGRRRLHGLSTGAPHTRNDIHTTGPTNAIHPNSHAERTRSAHLSGLDGLTVRRIDDRTPPRLGCRRSIPTAADRRQNRRRWLVVVAQGRFPWPLTEIAGGVASDR
jgi:hypothetical protein